MMPAYEVNVTVVVEHNGKPIVYSRTYLPEYKSMDAAEVVKFTPEKLMEQKPANYSADVYKQQADHVIDISKWMQRTLNPIAGTTLVRGKDFPTWVYRYDKPTEAFPYLIDGDITTKWCSEKETKDHGFSLIKPFFSGYKDTAVTPGDDRKVWALEFKTNFPITPTGFTLTTANDAGVFPGRNPTHMAIFTINGENYKDYTNDWVRIDNHNQTLNLPGQNMATKSYKLTEPQNAKNKQYFRIEIFQTADDGEYMQLGEFKFNYDD